MFGELKDRGISFGVRKIANHYLSDIGGEVLNFNLDSKNKKIFLDVMLKGELESLKVEIINYKITQRDDKSFIEFDEIHTSREWINTIISLYLKEKSFEVPNEYAKLLGVVV